MDIKRTNRGVCIDNFKASGAREGGYGVALIVNDEVCESAGVFTRNSVKAAPLEITQERVEGGLQALIINSGCANACVKGGVGDANRMCEIAAGQVGVNKEYVGVASTGIIGRRLDLTKIRDLTIKASRFLSNSEEGSKLAAGAIMTTDTKIKELSFEYKGIKIGGIAKGVGMIAPDLATMLCFISTNADLSRNKLQGALSKAVDKSFNTLVVDGDMSTNDMVLLMSNRRRRCSPQDFQHLLDYTTKEFAKLMAADGEGATKLIEVEVRGARSNKDASKGARAIISSPLVKTAIHGENPNWGRITAALGSVINLRFEKISIIFGSEGRKVTAVKEGRVGNLGKVREVLRSKEIQITVDLNSGKGKAGAIGCDLGPEYVKINAEYN